MSDIVQVSHNIRPITLANRIIINTYYYRNEKLLTIIMTQRNIVTWKHDVLY